MVVIRPRNSDLHIRSERPRSVGGQESPRELPRSETPIIVPESYEGLKTMAPVQVSAGNYHTGIVTNTGALYCWAITSMVNLALDLLLP